MARVIITAPFAQEWFGGHEDHQVPAANLFALIRALDAMAPGFAEAAEMGAALAVNGLLAGDWTQALAAEDEVLIVPKVAGG